MSPSRSREQSNEAPPACQWPPAARRRRRPFPSSPHHTPAWGGERKGARDRCAQVVSRDDRRTAAPSRSPSASRPILPRPPRRATRVRARRIPIVGIGIGIGGWLRRGRCEMQSSAGGRHADAQPADELLCAWKRVNGPATAEQPPRWRRQPCQSTGLGAAVLAHACWPSWCLVR